MASRVIEGPELDLLTASEVAHYLRLEVRTLRRLIADGEFPEPQQSSPKTPLWGWEDVVYYRLRMSLRSRLRRSPPRPKKGTPGHPEVTPVPPEVTPVPPEDKSPAGRSGRLKTPEPPG